MVVTNEDINKIIQLFGNPAHKYHVKVYYPSGGSKNKTPVVELMSEHYERMICVYVREGSYKKFFDTGDSWEKEEVRGCFGV